MDADETVEMESLREGLEFGRYRIVRRIGSGGMGTVYKAFDPTLDRTVALKVLHDKVEGIEAEQRLLREAQAMARLSHPNVVTVHDAGMKDGRPYVAMEMVEGSDLRAWLKSEKRGWREIVDQFVAAGDGLAAAHAVGLVHRDFKPGNVLVGRDGRVRVTDFGLARAAESADWEGLETTAASLTMPLTGAEASSPLETPLTQHGVVLGTPAYMAPEQALEGRADHRSDQYAFCVSLYVALFGEHPLGKSSSLPEFAARLASEEVKPPTADHQVPARVVDAIMKGLSRSPVDRFPSMHALLEMLRNDPAQRRKRWITATTAVAIAAIVVGLIGFMISRRQLCGAGDAYAAEVWNPNRRAQLEAHFASVAEGLGAEAVEAVATRLDDYTDRWATIHRQACVATRIRGEQSEALLDRQMACLRRRLREADHLLVLLEAGGRDLANSALDAVMGLDVPEVCADSTALVERLPLPEDEATRTAIDDLEDRLAAAKAEQLAGDYQTALDRLTEMAPGARELGYPPTLAEFMILKGFVEAELGLGEDAERSLREAFGAAEQGRDDRAGAVAAGNLMWVTGYLQNRFEEAERWSELASAKIERLGGDESVAADFADMRAGVLLREGRHREAIEVQEQALELLSRISGPESLDVAMALTTMGNALSNIGDYKGAVESYEKSLALKESLVGSDHPTLGFTLASLAQAYASLGEYQQAAELSRRAVGIFEKAFGPDDPQLAISLNNLAYSLEGLEQFDEARAMHERSMAIVSAGWGPEHPQIAISLLNLSSLEKQAGDFEAALEASRRAGEILTAAYGTEHPLYAYAANNTGVFLMETGQPAQGVVHLEKALAIRTAADTDPVLIAVTRYNLGRAQWEAGQRELGRRSVADAEKELAAIGEMGEEDLAAAREWLATH
jgi:tetratricopeptide (TPR) repeat protein/tRNA A-37 threonylcarbamoyl transferase component Bud32